VTAEGFIVFEGIDGSGTTTQSRMLYEYLRKKGVPTELTCEPTDSPAGRLIRKILKHESVMDRGTLPYLFSADRYNHVFSRKNGILQLTEQNTAVISDRYVFSSLAYQSVECDFDYVLQLNSRFPLPRLVFFIDIPLDTAMQRILGRRKDLDFVENEQYLASVIHNYRAALSLFAEKTRIVYLDGTQTREKLHDEICAAADAALCDFPQQAGKDR